MRISDWSSDVCSSDLCSPVMRAPSASTLASLCSRLRRAEVTSWQSAARAPGWRFTAMEMPMPVPQTTTPASALPEVTASATALRSEEHTSELQSLMRISYAVFCLKKKKKEHQQTT